MIKTSNDMGGISWGCKDCDYKTLFQTNLFSHIESHHFKDIRYECHFCQSSHPSKNSLRMHIRRKHPDNWTFFLCDITRLYKDFSDISFCQMLGSADDQIRQCYIRTELGEFQCLVCDKQSRTQQDIYRHVEAKHVNTGGYVCPECSKYCPTMNSFRNHKFRHHRNSNIQP